MRTALIVIDVQESFRRRPYWRDEEVPGFIARLQSLLDRCRQRRIPVLQVFHAESPDDPANAFARASGLVRTMAELDLSADEVFYKEVHSAMFGKAADGTTLEQWLRRHDMDEIVVTGIRTEQCCETTTRHASDLGFGVRYVTDATLTFPMQSRAGREYSTAEIRDRTELVLDGRFARIVSSAEAVA